MSKKTKYLLIFGAAFLVVGIPIIINECYKANCGYITVWDGSDVLGYYGTILGSVIAVVSIIATIAFTKKQIQRDSFLKNEDEKWDRLREIFLQILNDINPMRVFKDVMDNSFSDPTRAINLLQRYQLDCKMANDLLNVHLNMSDYPKFKELIDGIATTAEYFVDISQKEIDQYSDLRIWQHKDEAHKMLRIEKEHPGSFSKDYVAINEDVVEKIKTISYENIKLQITQLNTELVRAYEEKYRVLLQLTGSTFETIAMETQRQADSMLAFGKVRKRK